MTYYTPLTILVLFALFILCALVKENARISKKEKTILYLTYSIVALAAVSEWLGVCLNGCTDVSPWILRLVKLFDYVITPLAGGAVVLQFNSKTVWKKILFVVLSLNTLFQLISFFTGWMITIDGSNRYAHGPAYNVYMVFYLLVILLVIIECAFYGRRFRKQNRFSLFAILVLAIVGVALQEILGSEVRTSYIALTVCFALLFIHNSEFTQLAFDDKIQEQMIRISEDPLTGVFSRYAYIEEVQKYASSDVLPDDLVIFSIDINGLKRTNDTLGHAAGDELICGASDVIESVLSDHGKCFRTGGDEFIVIANTSAENAAELVSLLNKRAAEWHGTKVPGLSLAVGFASAAAEKENSIDKLIISADQEMYKEKAEYYRKAGIERRKGV